MQCILVHENEGFANNSFMFTVNLGARYNVYRDLYGFFSSQGQACTKLYIPKIYDRFEILYEPVIVYRRIWIDV